MTEHIFVFFFGDLRGIINGIDYDEYNPETDHFLAFNYNAKNFRKEKIKNKRALQEQLGLEQPVPSNSLYGSTVSFKPPVSLTIGTVP